MKEEGFENAAPDPASPDDQNRFSFYDADEVEKELHPPPPEGEKTRFNFYNADEVNAKSREVGQIDVFKALQSKRQPERRQPSERHAMTKRNGPSLNKQINRELPISYSKDAEFPNPSKSPNSNDILLSLQETEREHANRQNHREDQHSAIPRNTLSSNTNRTQVLTNESSEEYLCRGDDDMSRQDVLTSDEENVRRGVKNNDWQQQKKNPYEDAIKEAILMLRQNRPKISQDHTGKTLDLIIEPVENTDDVLKRSRTPEIGARSSKDEDLIQKARLSLSPNSDVRRMESEVQKERMAKYASRLAQLPQTETDPDSEKLNPNADARITAQQLFRSKARRGDDDLDLSGQPVAKSANPWIIPQKIRKDSNAGESCFSSRDEDVQRGVEQVLLAILKRANDSERGDSPQETDLLLKARSSFGSADEPEDDLASAVDSLMRPHSGYSIGSQSTRDERAARPSRKEASHHVVQGGVVVEPTSGRKSVVDELLEDDEASGHIQKTPVESELQHMNIISSNGVMQETPNQPTIPLLGHKNPSSMHVERSSPRSNLSQDNSLTLSPTTGTELEGMLPCIHSEMDDTVEDEQFHVDQDESANVLGRLGSQDGGTTGVVLEPQTPDIEPVTSPESPDGKEDSLKENEKMDDHLSKSPQSMLESLTEAIHTPISPNKIESLSMNSETCMSYMNTAIKEDDTSPNKCEIKDKYSISDETSQSPNRSLSNDIGANDLMRSLCSHLLPFGVDTSAKLSETCPSWDESNPNEAGYRIIRLTKSQLRRVEKAFEKMVNGLRVNSERDLSTSSHFGSDTELEKTKTKKGEKCNNTDSGFERDLEEAEKLLDNLTAVEKAQMHIERGKSRQRDTSSCSSINSDFKSSCSSYVSDAEGEGRTSPAFPETEVSLDQIGHEDFPGVRMSGKGEMGDLEFFSLPIIYKSNVTGFEATKDIYLEPGNVVAGQYLVENELGTAAFSTAYRCIDLNSSRDNNDHQEEVCLKVIKNTKDFFDQSLDEIKILELLRQTGECQENHIIEMKTFFYHREHLVIVTELLRQNLFEFNKFIMDNDEEPYFTLARLSYITRQCLVALKFVHSLDLVHSDVKPENILLGSYSRAKVKLIDFGSSCYLTDRQSSYIQSRSYRAPEVVLGLPYDGKIDIWSLGCVVAEMFTGEVTFQNDSIVSMLSRIEAVSGAFPRNLIAQGRCSGRFFTKSGLLCERVDIGNGDGESTEEVTGDLNLESDEEYVQHGEEQLFDVFQPKTTTLAARLGFDPNLMDKKTKKPHEHDQALFVDFMQRVLTIDPDSRPTAEEALKHPWIVGAELLTEDDIKYPS